MLASLLLLLLACPQGSFPKEPRFSSLVLTEGIRGGVIPPIVRRRVELGFDWNAGHYRATVYDSSRWNTVEGPYSTAALPAQDFEAILRGMRAGGLETLPPQPSSDGPDVYELDTGLELCDKDLLWANRASGGCTSSAAQHPPSADDLRAFSEIVQGIHLAVARLPLAPGCELDAGFLYRPADLREARAFLRAQQHVLQQPFCAQVDRTRVEVLASKGRYEFRFPWRALQRIPVGFSTNTRGDWRYDVEIDGKTLAVFSERCRPFEPPAGTMERRQAFLDSHPELPSRLRRLIAAGWVCVGMTREMAMAAWGLSLPTDANVSLLRCEGRGTLHFDREGRLLGSVDPIPSVGLGR
ncbi:MAG: hypothetical protein IPK67_19165 [Planctomycetes bacterium]|nr:hypothetical protein [Planctomycetota bacterium]